MTKLKTNLRISTIIGTAMLASRFVPLEYVFIGYGLAVTILVLLRIKVNP